VRFFPLLLLSACFVSPAPTTIVRGQVFYGTPPTQTALAGALVRLVESGSEATPRVAITQDNGEYRFDGVVDGSYALFFTTERWVFENNVNRVITVQKPEDSLDLVVDAVTFSPAGVLKGRVVSMDGSDQYEGIIINLEGTAFQARAAMDGSFDFGRLPTRAYRATAIGRGVVSEKPVELRVRAERESDVTVLIKSTPAPVIAPNRPPVFTSGGIEMEIVPPAAAASPMRVFDSSLLAPNQIVRGMKAIFRCKASDPDADALAYAWQVSGGTQKQLSADSVEWSSTSGAASIRCTVTDSQGAFVTATRLVDVRDFRLSGASLANGQVVFSQSDAGVPDYDLVVFDVTAKTYRRLPAPGNQIRPAAFGAFVLYQSDIGGTAENPSDVYALTLPAGTETQLSTSNSVEAYGIGPAGLFYSNNAGSTCQVLKRASPTTAASVVFPSSGVFAEANAACDRIVVGTSTVAIREATLGGVRWRLLDTTSGFAFDPPPEWAEDQAVAVAYAEGRYVVAIPSLRQVVSFDEADPAFTPTQVTTLPELAGTIVASVAGDASRVASSAYDTSGLFGTVRVSAATTKNIDAGGARDVLSVAGKLVLVGKPVMFETPPQEELELYDADALP
jgi:hypothetical protein